MRKLSDAVNIEAPSADYPKGRVRNKNGAILGTEYREELHGDIFQFFQKLVIDSGITENNLPDNVTNGYQLYDALKEIVKPKNTFAILESGTVMDTGAPLITITAQTYDRFIYVYTGGATTNTFDATISIDGNQVSRILGFGANASILLPAGVDATINWISSVGNINVTEQKIGV